MAFKKLKIEQVYQQDMAGCAIACLAMVMGKKYEDVRWDFLGPFETEGLSPKNIVDYLTDFGYVVLVKDLVAHTHPKDGFKELSTPFASAHILIVKQFNNMNYDHCVAMDYKGKIFNTTQDACTDLSRYYRIIANIGVYV